MNILDLFRGLPLFSDGSELERLDRQIDQQDREIKELEAEIKEN